MSDDKKLPESRGMGVGYVSLIMLFAVICLTVLATLSYQAARANDKLNEKSVSFTTAYYNADNRAKRLLSQLDEKALISCESGFFGESFAEYCGEYEVVTLRNVPEGCEVSFSEEISDNLRLSVVITFFSNPDDGVRYRVEEWKTVADLKDTDENLGVWDGTGLPAD